MMLVAAYSIEGKGLRSNNANLEEVEVVFDDNDGARLKKINSAADLLEDDAIVLSEGRVKDTVRRSKVTARRNKAMVRDMTRRSEATARRSEATARRNEDMRAPCVHVPRKRCRTVLRNGQRHKTCRHYMRVYCL